LHRKNGILLYGHEVKRKVKYYRNRAVAVSYRTNDVEKSIITTHVVRFKYSSKTCWIVHAYLLLLLFLLFYKLQTWKAYDQCRCFFYDINGKCRCSVIIVVVGSGITLNDEIVSCWTSHTPVTGRTCRTWRTRTTTCCWTCWFAYNAAWNVTLQDMKCFYTH
jgi:hypothetical protein